MLNIQRVFYSLCHLKKPYLVSELLQMLRRRNSLSLSLNLSHSFLHTNIRTHTHTHTFCLSLLLFVRQCMGDHHLQLLSSGQSPHISVWALRMSHAFERKREREKERERQGGGVSVFKLLNGDHDLFGLCDWPLTLEHDRYHLLLKYRQTLENVTHTFLQHS